MELLLRDGDYVPDGKGGFVTVEGDKALLQRALIRLSARRGAFPFLPEVGSRMHMLLGEKEQNWGRMALHYAEEALRQETGLRVSRMDLSYAGDDNALLTVVLQVNGEEAGVEVRI